MRVTRFSGMYRYLSNFYPVNVVYAGLVYRSVEHAYQAAKSIEQKDRIRIQEAATAADAKRLGSKLSLRPGWDDMRLELMEDLLRQKFSKPLLKEKLLSTGDAELVETNNWGDRFWGVDGTGANHLGKLLMAIRADLKKS